jgi:uncharacterized phage protein (TIGR01671 family)
MREILFRGKDISDCWHYGDLHVDTLELEDKYYINSRISVADPDFIEVQENSVGQYTGINDINGNMIFEGMEVHQLGTVTGDDTDFTGIVVFDEGCWWIDNSKDAVRLWSETAENTIIKEY